MLSRRQLLALATLLAPRPAWASSPALDARALSVEKSGRFGKKCLLLRPNGVPEDRPLPTLLLFHGLGETGSEALGIRAWADRYGLLEAYSRLRTLPIERTLPKQRYLSDDRLAELNRELAAAPLPELCIVCPFTPNVYKQQPTAVTLDRYAEYIEQALLPAVRGATATLPGPEHLGVSGVSLGGYVSLEIFLRRPKLFGAVGCVQGAFGPALSEVYARRLSEVDARHVHVVTSSLDPFRAAALRLTQRLAERGQAATLTDGEGPHDQRYLREAGTLEMLYYQARALHGESV